jgi:hypothetical protein
VLCQNDQSLDIQFKARILYEHWDVLHQFHSFSEIKLWLEGLTKDSHQWLNYFHAAYLNSAPNVTLSFRESKVAFWNMVNFYGTFIDGLFVV